MKNFRFNTICNITQEPQELQRYNRACKFIGKSAVIRCYQKLQVLTGDRFSTSQQQTPSICILNWMYLTIYVFVDTAFLLSGAEFQIRV